MSDEDLGRAVGALERRPGRQAYRPRRWPHILVRQDTRPIAAFASRSGRRGIRTLCRALCLVR
jgi:hypothetical protein